MKLRWLDRGTVYAPRMVLCLSEAEYLAAVKHCNVKNPGGWIDEERQVACVHTWELAGSLVCVVCLAPPEDWDPISIAATLTHESVHIFQRLCDSIGEDRPSREFEAYSIERISERLMREYARRLEAR